MPAQPVIWTCQAFEKTARPTWWPHVPLWWFPLTFTLIHDQPHGPSSRVYRADARSARAALMAMASSVTGTGACVPSALVTMSWPFVAATSASKSSSSRGSTASSTQRGACPQTATRYWSHMGSAVAANGKYFMTA